MAQEPWANVPVVRDRRLEERERAETRYRNTTGDRNPLARPVILPGEEGYAGPGEFLPDAGVVVRNEPWNDVPVVSERELAERQAVEIVGRAGVLNIPGFNAFTRGAVEQAPFLDEGLAALAAFGTGQSFSDARRQQGMVADYDRENNPTQRRLGGIAGFSAGLAAPGGAYISGARGAAQVGRAAAVGAGYGGAYGAGAGEDTYASRLTGLGVGAVTGAAGGAVVQRGAQIAAPYAQRLGGIIGNAVGRGDPEVTAARRLTRGLDLNTAQDERARLQALGVDASLMDVAGGQTERAVRMAAGPAGEAADLAVNNMTARQQNLKPDVMGLTRNLSDDPRTATAVREGLDETRSTLAERDYAPAYAERVAVDEQTLRALSDEPGRAALRRARAAAVARQNDAQVAEIDQLMTGQTTEVSAGTLDRVRIAMTGRAQAMQQRPDTRDIAGGLFGRAGQIDAALEGVEALAPARATYRNLSGAMEAIDTAEQVFNTAPDDFAARIASLTPEQRQAMIIGVRQEIMDTLGGQRAAGTGSLQTLSEAPYARQNLEALLGPEEATQYLGSIRERVSQSQRAARVSPNTGSQTFGRLADETGLVEIVAGALDGARSLGDPMAAARTGGRIANLSARLTMTPEVRSAIVRLGIGSADELERVVELATGAQAAGRPPPREVRAYLAKVQGQLGAQSPITVRLEQLLLPSRVAAEEEQR